MLLYLILFAPGMIILYLILSEIFGYTITRFIVSALAGALVGSVISFGIGFSGLPMTMETWVGTMFLSFLFFIWLSREK